VKCPHCGKNIDNPKAEKIVVDGVGGIKRDGTALICGNATCGKIMSVQLDPVLVQGDTIRSLKLPSNYKP
jgi:hypothetical protein